MDWFKNLYFCDYTESIDIDNGNGKKDGHAVVAYSYSGNDFTCHYGWNGYSEVTIVGTFGSIYCMELK